MRHLRRDRDEQDGEVAPDRGPPHAEPPVGPAGMLALQQQVGNAAVARMVELQAARALVQRDPLATGDDYITARRARADWIAVGVRGPQDHTPSTGRGGFGVAYVPDVGHGALNVHLNGAVDFKPGIEIVTYLNLKFAVARSPAPQVAAAALAINQLPNEQREAAAAPWQWSAGDQATFLNAFETMIEQVWDRKFTFACTRPFWQDLGADVNVLVGVHGGAKTDQDHMSVTSYKVPDNATVATTGNVGIAYPGAPGNARDQSMVLNSSDVRPRSDISLTLNAAFETESERLELVSRTDVAVFASKWQSGGTGPVCGTCGKEIRELAGTPINIHVQGYGAEPERTARLRFSAIVDDLVGGGMTDARTRAVFHFDGEGDQVRLLVGTGQPQVVAAHEAGHMFGLADEYTAPFSGTGSPLGTQVDPGLGQAQGLPAAVAENTDSIMSVGNAVKPQHYATFLEALKKVTAMNDWELGTPTTVMAPGVDGPLPRPPGQGDRQDEPATAYA